MEFLSSFKSRLAHLDPATMAIKLAPFLISLGTLLIILSGFILMIRAKQVAAKLFLAGVGSIVVGAGAHDVLTPLIRFVQSLPFWAFAVFIIFMMLALLGAIASIIIGRAAAASMVGNLASDVVKGVFYLLVMPFRALRRLLERYVP